MEAQVNSNYQGGLGYQTSLEHRQLLASMVAPASDPDMPDFENEGDEVTMPDLDGREFDVATLLDEEIDKVSQTPDKIGVLTVQSANRWMESAAKQPDPVRYFDGLITKGETTCLFASTNVGKSILAVQIGEEIAWTEPVLYIDLELSQKQFETRYKDKVSGIFHVFPDKFHRAEVSQDFLPDTPLGTAVIKSVEDAAERGFKCVIIDNLSVLCADAEDGKSAGTFVLGLLKLKKKYDMTVIVVAHTPKRRGGNPITVADLAGSAKLGNFFDAVIALARSDRDNDLRYIKQVKCRSDEYKYTTDGVLIMELLSTNGWLHFEPVGVAPEDDHLSAWSPEGDALSTRELLKEKVADLTRQGCSIRAIAEQLGIGRHKVHDLQKEAMASASESVTYSSQDFPAVTSVTGTGDVTGETTVSAEDLEIWER